jgi:hypothetical protein
MKIKYGDCEGLETPSANGPILISCRKYTNMPNVRDIEEEHYCVSRAQIM